MDGLKVGELIIVRVDTNAEEKAGISPVYDFVVSELNKGLFGR